MDILCTKNNCNLIVKIIGDIDHHSSTDIRDKVDKEFARTNSKNIIFDFSEVSFMDSSGIGMIIGRYKKLGKVGGKIFIASIPEDLGKIFKVSGLPKIINTYDKVEEAIENL